MASRRLALPPRSRGLRRLKDTTKALDMPFSRRRSAEGSRFTQRAVILLISDGRMGEVQYHSYDETKADCWRRGFRVSVATGSSYFAQIQPAGQLLPDRGDMLFWAKQNAFSELYAYHGISAHQTQLRTRPVASGRWITTRSELAGRARRLDHSCRGRAIRRHVRRNLLKSVCEPYRLWVPAEIRPIAA